MGSVRHLLSDLTLPVLSLFSGGAFDSAVKAVFERGAQVRDDRGQRLLWGTGPGHVAARVLPASGSGHGRRLLPACPCAAQRLEDLWLPYFCVTTNLTKGEASVHTQGLLWKLVRGRGL
jgi:lysophospholipid hydrolase